MERGWIAAEPGGGGGRAAGGDAKEGDGGGQQQTLRVLQWNVLADGLCALEPERGGFKHVEEEALDWSGSRWPMLLTELRRCAADIITLQEVDHYHDDIGPALREGGEYGSLFLPKSAGPGFAFRGADDGNALFWRRSRLELVQSACIHYAHMSQSDDKRYPQNGGAIAALFELREVPGQRVVVATTHLKAAKTLSGEEARLEQVEQLLRLVEDVRGSDAENTPVVIAGDFNATTLSTAGRYDPLAMDYVLAHEMGLRSVYDDHFGRGSMWSTFKTRFIDRDSHKYPDALHDWKQSQEAAGVENPGTPDGPLKSTVRHGIDYVLYTGQGIIPTQLLDLPDIAGDDVGYPSAEYPSDHICLGVDFTLLNP